MTNTLKSHSWAATQDPVLFDLMDQQWLESEPEFLPGEERAVRSLVAWCCMRNHMPAVLAKRITVRWSNRMTRAAGKATNRGELILSAPLARAMPYVERRNTIIHEACHIMVGVQHGHGHRWKAAMVRCGERPERVYRGADVDWSKVPTRKKLPRHAYKCGCRSWQLSAVRHRRVERGAGYRCTHCSQALWQVKRL